MCAKQKELISKFITVEIHQYPACKDVEVSFKQLIDLQPVPKEYRICLSKTRIYSTFVVVDKFQLFIFSIPLNYLMYVIVFSQSL